jgi:hypothetical protein
VGINIMMQTLNLETLTKNHRPMNLLPMQIIQRFIDNFGLYGFIFVMAVVIAFIRMH